MQTSDIAVLLNNAHTDKLISKLARHSQIALAGIQVTKPKFQLVMRGVIDDLNASSRV